MPLLGLASEQMGGAQGRSFFSKGSRQNPRPSGQGSASSKVQTGQPSKRGISRNKGLVIGAWWVGQSSNVLFLVVTNLEGVYFLGGKILKGAAATAICCKTPDPSENPVDNLKQISKSLSQILGLLKIFFWQVELVLSSC